MKTQQELTICSVYHSPENKKLLEMNWDFTEKLNPGEPLRWVVADNAPPEMKERIDGKKFLVVSGARKEDMPDYLRPWMRGSYHHTLAIKRSLPSITTRYALFLDSDFYIVRPRWIKEVLRHMRAKNLAFFGVPWHPRHIKKYRYFPSIHSLFVDLEKVKAQDLNFIPQYEELLKPSFARKLQTRIARVLFSFVSKERRNIGTSHDSGYDIFRRFGRRKGIVFECALPVFKSSRDLAQYPMALSATNRTFEKLLPERFCFIPKNPASYTTAGFADCGYVDAAGNGWEEFMWQGVPFGFHLRGLYRLDEGVDPGGRRLRATLDTFEKGRNSGRMIHTI